MSHLTLEALARLVDEAPEEQELTHLAGCGACRTELDALRQQRDALAALPKMMPAPDAWPELRDRLRRERLVRAGSRSRIAPVAMRVAAALALFVAGGAAGYAVRGPTEAGPQAALADASDDFSRPAAPRGTGVPVVDEPAADAVTRQVDQAEAAYFDALDRYMQINGVEPGDPATRLATLDNMVLTTAEALNESPSDPLINSYYLTIVAHRNAYLRQLATSAEPVF